MRSKDMTSSFQPGSKQSAMSRPTKRLLESLTIACALTLTSVTLYVEPSNTNKGSLVVLKSVR